MSHKVSREFWVCASHMINGHPKCGRLHGHNYKIVVSIEGSLNQRGMVMDFGDLDAIVKPLIDEMDHYTFFSKSNIVAEPELYELCKRKGWAVELPVENATAEEIASYIHSRVWGSLNLVPERIHVLVQETPRNQAEFNWR